MPAYIIGGAILVILVLAAIAGYLHWKLFQVNIQRDKKRVAQREELREKRQQNLNSINVLLRAMLEGQVSLTEACMRTCVLMETLFLPEAEKATYASFYKLANATSHIPILAEWKALPTKKKLEFDREREDIERQYGDFVSESARVFLERQENYQAHIQSL